jgi:hypothetical protein
MITTLDFNSPPGRFLLQVLAVVIGGLFFGCRALAFHPGQMVVAK